MSDQTSHTRASLLFDGPVDLDFISLVHELHRVFRNIAVEFDETAVAEGSHALFISEGMILRVALSDQPVDPDALRQAQRPLQPKVSIAIVDALLDDVSQKVEVSVQPGQGRVLPERTRLAACYHVVRHMLRRHEASLVLWHQTETLFTAEEFENPLALGAPQPRRPERSAARRASRRPAGFGATSKVAGFQSAHMAVNENHQRLDDDMADAMSAARERLHEEADFADAEERLRNSRAEIFDASLLDSARETASRPRAEIGRIEQISVYLMTISIMLLWFPVGIAMLIYNVLRGENLNATARAMAITSVGIGVSSLIGSGALQGLV